MRAAIVLSFVLVAVTVAGQTPARSPSAPSSPTSGALGAVQPRPAAAPTPAKDPNTAIIRGRVVRADNGRPLAGARVTIDTGDTVTEWTAATADDEGRFELTKLSAGRKNLVASKSGFVTLAFGQRGNGPSVFLDLAAGQVLNGIDFALPKGGVISGVILDEWGGPLTGAPVRLFRMRYRDGERKLAEARFTNDGSGTNGAADVTDDLGQFRLFGLVPGSYYLAAGPANAEATSSRSGSGSSWYGQATFYPGTLSAGTATPIAITAGEEITGLSFAVTPVSLATIRGVVRATDGTPIQPETVGVTKRAELGSGGRSRTSFDGSFLVQNLSPGEYTIFARHGDQTALVRVAVDGGDLFLSLTLQPGRLARGRLVFDGVPPVNDGSQLWRVSLSAVDTSVQSKGTVTPEGDWTFAVGGLVRGAHRVSVATPTGWTLKSVERNGSDITDLPIDLSEGDLSGIEIRLTQRATTVTGRVSDARGQPASASVVVFSEDSSKWVPGTHFVRPTHTDQNGRFTVSGLPPARYFVVAIDGLDFDEAMNPEVLDQLSRIATRIALGDGETRAVNVRTVPAP